MSNDALYRVRPVDGGFKVLDREGRPVSELMPTQADAVGHAKELARRDGSAQIIVHRPDDSIASEFFYGRDERAALSADDSVATVAATHPVHARPR